MTHPHCALMGKWYVFKHYKFSVQNVQITIALRSSQAFVYMQSYFYDIKHINKNVGETLAKIVTKMQVKPSQKL